MTDHREGQPTTGIVVGLGSIGQRHARLMEEVGLLVHRVSRRLGTAPFSSVAEAVAKNPDAFLVIASETQRHMEDLRVALSAGHRGPVLVEKPLAAQLSDVPAIAEMGSIRVGYNLRFAPPIQALRRALKVIGGDVIGVRMHVGQHLDTWRPSTNTKEGYSAHSERGGGVLRDLSHELDLSSWLWGRPIGFCALGGRRGHVTVDSDDFWSILLRTERNVDVLLSLNYLDRPATRFIHVNTTTGTLQCNLVNGLLSVDGEDIPIITDRDCSYRAMWADLLGTAPGETSDTCTFEEAKAVVGLIERIECHAHTPQWVSC